MAVLKGAHYKSLVFSSLIAGYAMVFPNFWFDGFMGWFSASNATLWQGNWHMFVAHEIDSIIFGWVFVAFVFKFLPGGGWLKGSISGVILAIAVMVAMMIAGAGGATMAKMMQSMPQSAMVGFFVTHIIWGLVLGLLYNDTHCTDKDGKKCCC